jgi:hypothetical protein
MGGGTALDAPLEEAVAADIVIQKMFERGPYARTSEGVSPASRAAANTPRA